MGPAKHHQDHNPRLNQSSNSQFQSRTVPLVVTVSIFSGMLLFFFFFYSLLFPLCFHSSKSFRFSAYFMELQPLGFTPSKIHMFLLCNGIMVILAKSSGLMETGPSGFDVRGSDVLKEPTENRRTTDAEEKLTLAVKEEFLIEKDEIQKKGSELVITVASCDEKDDDDDDDEIKDEFNRDERLIAEQAMQEQPREVRMITDGAVIDCHDDSDDDEDDDEADGELSLEELNRKFDEFIKKMKGELRCQNLVTP